MSLNPRMAMNLRTATLFAACVAAAALVRPAHAQTDTATAAAAAPAHAAEAPRPRHNRNEITRAEMVEKGAHNVYDGIRMVHASFLRPSRSLSSSTQQNPVVAVYRDGAYAGGTGVLRDIGVESISKIEYVEPNEAVQRFGSQAAGGAIVVYTGAGG